MSNSTLDCFLLTAHYRDAGAKFEITLWGAADSGERVRVFVDDFRPMFFCLRSTPANLTAPAAERKALNMRALDMRDLDCLYFDTHAAMQHSAGSLRAAGYPVCESDVNPMQRYLMERMVSGSMRISGTRERTGRFTGFKNPRLRGCEFIPDLSVMSICINTAPDGGSGGGAIREAACVEDGRACLFVVKNGLDFAGPPPAKIHYCDDERRLLTDLMKYITSGDPDVLTGADIADHTLRILQERCLKLGLRFDVGREGGSRVFVSTRNARRRDGHTSTKTVWNARIPGRVVMDLATMLRAYHRSNDDDGHIDADGSLAAATEALNLFNEAEILPNAIERSRRSGQALDSIGGSVASFDHLYLPRLHRAGFAAGDTADIRPPAKALPGGYVLEPAPGLYKNVLVFDFKSLYPSIIMTFMIDPLGFRIAGGNRIATPVGTTFSKDTSIMPEIIRELMDARATAVKLRNPYLSQAIKLLMNSFAGVLGSTGCRFFSDEISPSITLTGQHILKLSIEHIEKTYGKSIIYGDTDSIFVDLGAGCPEGQAAELGVKISRETDAWLRETLMEQYGAASALALKYEEHYNRFFIPPLRGGDAGQGTKKHYCGAVVKADGRMELTFKGMESARSDWTDLAKEFQRDLFIMFFSEKQLETYIATTAERLRRGEFDDKLVYRKHVRKELDAYTSNIPPHVQAAKLLDTPVRTVRYYITKNGPQPVEKLSAPIDYQHYMDSQLRPVADSILIWMGSDFDRAVSGQMELFA
ncbi:MAG: DNA polymerase II [Chitinispirillales bacterium]|jgi:DNA polymerase-2|nr:DNA polymerase II [Chitinispirillales bacterium]